MFRRMFAVLGGFYTRTRSDVMPRSLGGGLDAMQGNHSKGAKLSRDHQMLPGIRTALRTEREAGRANVSKSATSASVAAQGFWEFLEAVSDFCRVIDTSQGSCWDGKKCARSGGGLEGWS